MKRIVALALLFAAVVVPIGTVETAGATGIDVTQYCKTSGWPYETAVWYRVLPWDTKVWAKIQSLRTRGGTAEGVSVVNGTSFKSELFAQSGIGGTFKASGLTTMVERTVDWKTFVGNNANVDVQAEVLYGFYQLACRSYTLAAPTDRFVPIGEYRPIRPTGGIRYVARSTEPFTCNSAYKTEHPGTYELNVSRGRTRTVTNALSVGGALGRASTAYSTTESTTTTSSNRFTVVGTRAWTQKFYLCGSNATAPYATVVKEVS